MFAARIRLRISQSAISSVPLGYHAVRKASVGSPSFPASLITRPLPSGVLVAFIALPIYAEQGVGRVGDKAQRLPVQRLTPGTLSTALFLLQREPN